jgi:hypothetical protein
MRPWIVAQGLNLLRGALAPALAQVSTAGEIGDRLTKGGWRTIPWILDC